MMSGNLAAHCKHCGEPIRWGENNKDSWIPLSYSSDPKGRWTFVKTRKIVHLAGVELELAKERGDLLFKAHAADCHARQPKPAGSMPPTVRQQLAQFSKRGNPRKAR